MEKSFTLNDKAAEIFGCLSNKKRLRLFKEVVRESGTLRDIHERIADQIGISHRETTHTYLEQLCDADLIKKEKSNSYVYSSDIKSLRFEFESV